MRRRPQNVPVPAPRARAVVGAGEDAETTAAALAPREAPSPLHNGPTMTQPREKAIQQIVSEVGRYPHDAFQFVQECIGAASDMVHGPPSPQLEELAKYMDSEQLSSEDLRRRYEGGELPENFAALVEDLGGAEKLNRHVTGQQLCWAIRDVAQQRWGLLARTVLGLWNVNCTEDIGVIVFALVNNCWLQKQPTDTQADFDAVFDFRQAFDQSYQLPCTVQTKHATR